jgi:uncharacterized protein (DUF433 family)
MHPRHACDRRNDRGAMSAGRTIEQLLADFPYIEAADIREALAFAASLAQGHEIRLAS